jgi:predicted nucleic acid-binding protein
VYLIDTNVIREFRKGARADSGVRQFFERARTKGDEMFLSVVTVGELRRGIELLRYRGDLQQATRLEEWFASLLREYERYILPMDADIGQLWGRLRVPHPENAIDKIIAATALSYDLTVVTRNVDDFAQTGVRLFNPFTQNH